MQTQQGKIEAEAHSNLSSTASSVDDLKIFFQRQSSSLDEKSLDDASSVRGTDHLMEKEERPKSANELIPYYTPVRLRNNTYDHSRVRQLKDKFQNRFFTINEPPASETSLKTSSSSSSSPRPVSSPMPPSKPPRTFAHDAYVQEKQHLKALVEKKYRQTPNSAESSDNRRRSKSVDTANSSGTTSDSSSKQSNQVPFRRKSRSNFPPHVDDVFRHVTQSSRSTLITNTDEEEDFYDAHDEIPDIIDESLKNRGDSVATTSLSPPDLGDAVDYAKSVRSPFPSRSISHYNSLSEFDYDERETTVCSFIYYANKSTGTSNIYPRTSFGQTRIDLINKFSRCYQSPTPLYSWITFADETLLHSYLYIVDDTVLAIGSELYSPQFYLLLLEKLIELRNDDAITDVVIQLLKMKIPLPGEKINIAKSQSIQVPRDSQITSTKPHMLMSTLSPENVYHLVASLVAERKVVLVSSDVYKLTETSKALLSLLFPLQWDYMYWPVVPSDLITLCAAITDSYLIGLESKDLNSFLKSIEKRGRQMYILDIDCDEVIMKLSDEDKILPKMFSSSVSTALNLAKNMCDPSDVNRDSVIREVFLNIFVDLLGPVTAFIDENIFDRDSFIYSMKSKCTKNFLHWFIDTRTFDNFKKYWQLKLNHYKYIPPVNVFLYIDAFERKSEPFRLNCSNNKKHAANATHGTSRNMKEPTSRSNGSAIKGLENRLRAIKSKLVKNAFK